MRRSSSFQLRMCSNISTESTRSTSRSRSKSFASAVTISTLPIPRLRASRSMCSRCGREYETPVTRAFG